MLYVVPRLSWIYARLQAFRSGFLKSNLGRIDECQAKQFVGWIRDRSSQALNSLPKAHPEDAAAIIHIVRDHDDQMFEDL